MDELKYEVSAAITFAISLNRSSHSEANQRHYKLEQLLSKLYQL
jgi:uncharacterized protein YlaN (UPF0358 family)